MKTIDRAMAMAGTVLILAMLCGADAGAPVVPANNLSNPYRTVAPWGKLPDGRRWGAVNAVAIDGDGESLWVADRCGASAKVPPPGELPFVYDSCAGSKRAPILKFDAEGTLRKSFGAGLFISPHKIYIDGDRNVWVADLRGVNPREAADYPGEGGKGHTVTKFSPEGKVLLTIGKPGIAGDPPEGLTEPTSLVIAANGDIFITEGHGGQSPASAPQPVARISQYTRDGKFVRSYGKFGSGPLEFSAPHDIAIDDQGRLFVADRGNNRLQIISQDGRFIAEWKQFGRASGVAIRDGMIYVADSDSESDGGPINPGWRHGIRLGLVKDGKPLYWIPDPLELKGTSGAEGLAVDAEGNIYGGEVGPRQLVKHIRRGS